MKREKIFLICLQNQVSLWQSILAGGAAGGVESLLTVYVPEQHKAQPPRLLKLTILSKYPTEYFKTHQQLFQADRGAHQSPLRLLASTIRQHGISQLYIGSFAFCASNASKYGVRLIQHFSLCPLTTPPESQKRHYWAIWDWAPGRNCREHSSCYSRRDFEDKDH